MARRKATPKAAKPRVAKEKPLTVKERLFVAYYLGSAEANGSEAARRAGYTHVAVTACKLLRKTNIRAAIEAKLNTLAMEQDEILVRLSEMASASIEEFVTIGTDGAPRVNLKAARSNGRLFLIKAIRWTKFGPSIELHDSQAALDKLLQVYGAYDRGDEKNAAEPVNPAVAAMMLEMAERLAERPIEGTEVKEK